MIYNKDAAFSYPILTNNSSSYINSEFVFDVENLNSNNNEFIFHFSYFISSNFIRNLLEQNKAEVVFILSSQDNFFKRLKLEDNKVILSKSRVSLTNRTKVQLHIHALEDISLSECTDLNQFYEKYKSEIIIPKNSLLGFSNIIEYKGSKNNPEKLFEIDIMESQKEPFKIELGQNTIILRFKDKKYQLNHLKSDRHLKNMYIYSGLSRALSQFIINNDHLNEGSIQIDELSSNDVDDLDQKLLTLMKNKGVDNLSHEKIDQVISDITDGIIEKYIYSIERLAEYAN